MGYNPGPADGQMGRRTRDAIRAYQYDRQLTIDGQASERLLAHIRSTRGESQQAVAAEPDCRNYTQTIKVEREDPVVKHGRVCREDDGNWRIVE